MAPQLSVIHDAANETKQRKANPQPRLTDTRALVPTAFRFSQALKGDTQCLKRSPHLRTAPARTLQGAVAPGSLRLPWEPVTAAGPTAGGRPSSTFSEPRGTSRGWRAPWGSLSAGWWQEAAGTGGAAPPLVRLSVPRLPAHGTSQGVTGRHRTSQGVTGRHKASGAARGGRGGSGRHGAAHGRLRLWPLRRHFPCHARGARRPLGASESPGPGDAGAPGACQDVRAENKGLTAEGSRRHGRRTPPRARAHCTAGFSTLGRTRRGPQGLAARTLRAACARLPHTLQSTTHRHRVSDRRENRRDFASP